MAALSDDGLLLWERLRNLHFGAEQAQKAGESEASQVQLAQLRMTGHGKSIDCSLLKARVLSLV